MKRWIDGEPPTGADAQARLLSSADMRLGFLDTIQPVDTNLDSDVISEIRIEPI